MSQILSTDTVAQRDRCAFWTEMICNVYVQLGCDPKPCDEFSGAIVNHRLPTLDMSLVSSRAQTVSRTASHLSRSSDDCFLVSIQTKGKGVIRQDGRDAVLQPGDFALYDSTRQYQLVFEDDFEQIVLKLSGERMRGLLRDTHKLTATTVSGAHGAGHLLITMLETLKNDVALLQPASSLAVANGVMNILVAGLQTLPSATQRALPHLASYHLSRIKALVDERLNDPELSVGGVAEALGISPSHIHRLFKTEALSLSQYIWQQRLDACGRDLLDPCQAGRSVGDIAFGRGFNDAAHFSRAFKDHFGCSPREWRQRRGAQILP